MKLREKTNLEIYEENKVPYAILTNVVEEENTRNKIKATLQILSKILSGTLGPYGSTTTIQDREMRHFSTKDGFDILNRVSFDDELSRTIVDLLRVISSSQVSVVGDGSTSAIVVANALFSAITDLKTHPEFEKVAAKDIVDILNDVEEILEKEIRDYAHPISEDFHELKQIATIASNNDYAAGNLMHEIYSKVGKEGFITTEVLKKTEKDSYEIKKGIEWSRGFIDTVYGKE